MRKSILIILAMVMLIVTVSSQAFSGPVVLKGVTAFPKNHMNNDPVQMFIDKINEKAAGKVKIEWVGGPEVIKTFDQAQALKMGMIDVLLYYPFGYMKSVMPESWCKGLSELAEWEERKTGAFEVWSEIIDKRLDAKYIGRFHSLVPFTLFSNKEIRKVTDLKGMKIRVMPLYIPFIKALGAAPVTIPPPEIYTSLERGVVDGFIWPDVGMASFGLQEVTKYVIRPGFFQIEPATMISNKKWNKIPADVQGIIMEVMQDMEYIASMRNQLLVMKEDRIRNKAGMQTIQLAPDQAAEIQRIAADKTWEYVTGMAPEYAPKLKKLTSKSALPKGTFPWQD